MINFKKIEEELAIKQLRIAYWEKYHKVPTVDDLAYSMQREEVRI